MNFLRLDSTRYLETPHTPTSTGMTIQPAVGIIQTACDGLDTKHNT